MKIMRQKENKKLYYFDFDATLWLSMASKVQLLNHFEKGVFIDLVAMCLIKNGKIKNDRFLPRKLKLNEAKLSTCLDLLSESDIILLKDGFLSIKFIDEKIKKISDISQKRAAAGRQGGSKSKQPL